MFAVPVLGVSRDLWGQYFDSSKEQSSPLKKSNVNRRYTSKEMRDLVMAVCEQESVGVDKVQNFWLCLKKDAI